MFSTYNKALQEEKALTRVDSTYVALSAKLFAAGIKIGPYPSKRLVKYSVGLKGSLPASVKVYTDAAYISDDRALSELIDEATCLSEGVMVFDRGLQCRDAFDRFTATGKSFVGRCKTNTHFQVTHTRRLPRKPPVEASVVISSDQGRFSLPERSPQGPSTLPVGPSKGETKRRGYLACNKCSGGRCLHDSGLVPKALGH